MSSRDSFFELIKRPLHTKEITIEGKQFFLRELSEADSAEMEVKMQTKDGIDWQQHRRLLVSYCLVDENGERIVKNPDDLKAASKSLIGKFYNECLLLGAFEPGEVEALAKKSNEVESSE